MKSNDDVKEGIKKLCYTTPFKLSDLEDALIEMKCCGQKAVVIIKECLQPPPPIKP